MVAAGDKFRAEAFGRDAVKWLRAHKALATKVDRGHRVAEVRVRNAANEAYFAARAAAKYANRVLNG
jgi:hypothetical protein